jgi:hypothetical protein
MRVRPIITETDLPLVLDVIHCNESLERTLYTALTIERAAAYPIGGIDDLRSTLSYADRFPLGDRSLRLQDLAEILPTEVFPIESRDELVSQLIMAFERDRMAPIKTLADQQEAGEVLFEPPAVTEGA